MKDISFKLNNCGYFLATFGNCLGYFLIQLLVTLVTFTTTSNFCLVLNFLFRFPIRLEFNLSAFMLVHKMEPAKEKVFDFRLEVVVNNGVKITVRKGQMDTVLSNGRFQASISILCSFQTTVQNKNCSLIGEEG